MITQDRRSNQSGTPSIPALAREKGLLPSLLFDSTIFVFLGLYTVFFLYHSIATISFPYILDSSAGAVFSVATHMAEGNGIYLDTAEPPYIGANYAPFYYVFNAAAIRLFGQSAMYGSLLSLLATLGLSGLVFVVVKGKTGDKYAGLVSALFLLSLGPVYTWGAAYKADMTAVALGMLGYYLLSKERPRPVLAAVILLLAFFTKQTMVTSFLAGATYLGLRAFRNQPQGWSHAVRFAIAAGGLGAAAFALFNSMSDEQMFKHVVTFNLQDIWLDQTLYALLVYFRSHIIILAVAVAAGIGALSKNIEGWSIYFFIAFAGMVASVGKVGAYNNYFIESLTIVCILFGFGLARWRRGRLSIVLQILTILQLALLAHIPFYAEPAYTPRFEDQIIGRRLVERLSSLHDPILAENVAWLVNANRPVTLDDPFLFSQLAAAGRWDQSNFVDMIDRQLFSLVLLEFDPYHGEAGYHLQRFTPEMLGAILDNYRLSEQIGGFYLMSPRESS